MKKNHEPCCLQELHLFSDNYDLQHVIILMMIILMMIILICIELNSKSQLIFTKRCGSSLHSNCLRISKSYIYTENNLIESEMELYKLYSGSFILHYRSVKNKLTLWINNSVTNVTKRMTDRTNK